MSDPVLIILLIVWTIFIIVDIAITRSIIKELQEILNKIERNEE